MARPMLVGFALPDERVQQWIPATSSNIELIASQAVGTGYSASECLHMRLIDRGEDPAPGRTGVFRYRGEVFRGNGCRWFEGETTAHSFKEAEEFFSYRASAKCFKRKGKVTLDKESLWRER